VSRYGAEWLTDPFVIVMALLSILMVVGGTGRAAKKSPQSGQKVSM